jgi:hypothetical protein
MMQASYNTFGTPSTMMMRPENNQKEFGSFAQTLLHENVEDRMSVMMESYTATPFAGARTDRRKAQEEREAQFEALFDSGILRPSDVFVQIDSRDENSFLAKLLPGTLSYYQRVRENQLLFREFCRNEGEQHRIIQEIVESVWLNEGRFLTIDNESNSVVVVEDTKVLAIVSADLMDANSFPAFWKEAKNKGTRKPKAQRRDRGTRHSPQKHATSSKDIIGLNIVVTDDEHNGKNHKAKGAPHRRNNKGKPKGGFRSKLDGELKSGRSTAHKKKYKKPTGMKY